RDLVKVVGGGGVQLDAEAGRAGAGKLLGVNPWYEAEPPARLEHPTAILQAESAAVAEAVDEFRQPLSRDGRDQTGYHLFHILGGAPAETRGKRMESKQRRDQIQRGVRLRSANG